MKIFDWFDIKNPDHAAAYRHLQDRGFWPPGFIPDSIEHTPGWTHALNYYIIKDLLEERDRLLRGDFTPEEFQDLCHDRSREDRQAFFDGCAAYQTQLFGISERAAVCAAAKAKFKTLGPTGCSGYEERGAFNDGISTVISIIGD